jgi:methylglutamate dehydrogenase subunit C
MAALTAARSGARVIVCDEDFCLGGRLLADRREVGGMPGNSWAAQVVNELGSLPDVRLMPRTTVFGVYDGGIYEAMERVADHLPEPPPHAPRQRLWRIIAKRAVLAAGRKRTRHRIRRQRSPRRHAGIGDADLCEPLRSRARSEGRVLH